MSTRGPSGRQIIGLEHIITHSFTLKQRKYNSLPLVYKSRLNAISVPLQAFIFFLKI
jgi:hypothetical protein